MTGTDVLVAKGSWGTYLYLVYLQGMFVDSIGVKVLEYSSIEESGHFQLTLKIFKCKLDNSTERQPAS